MHTRQHVSTMSNRMCTADVICNLLFMMECRHENGIEEKKIQLSEK